MMAKEAVLKRALVDVDYDSDDNDFLETKPKIESMNVFICIIYIQYFQQFLESLYN